MDWVDFTLLGDEASLAEAIRSASAAERERVGRDLMMQLGIDRETLEKSMFRLLIERARPLALPASVWRRLLTASDNPEVAIRENFARRHVAPTPQRVAMAVKLYIQYTESRQKIKVGEDDLKRCGYRCEHCGLAFCDEDLQSRGFVSPFKLRNGVKTDAFKPHWNGSSELREPTLDHYWPVTSYGDNALANRRVLCKGCNGGKANYLALEQLPGWAGMLVQGGELSKTGAISQVTFYAQVRQSPRCEYSGDGPDAVELTVELRDPHAPAVLDNLRTIASPGL